MLGQPVCEIAVHLAVASDVFFMLSFFPRDVSDEN